MHGCQNVPPFLSNQHSNVMNLKPALCKHCSCLSVTYPCGHPTSIQNAALLDEWQPDVSKCHVSKSTNGLLVFMRREDLNFSNCVAVSESKLPVMLIENPLNVRESCSACTKMPVWPCSHVRGVKFRVQVEATCSSGEQRLINTGQQSAFSTPVAFNECAS